MEDCDPSKKRKVLIVFDDVITHIETNKMLSPVITKLFLRGRKLNILLVFSSHYYYFIVPKTVTLNATHLS